jgi:hypothetical protein
VAVCPALIVAEVELPFAGVMEKSTAEADSGTDCGEPEALSVNCRFPVAEPTTVALNVTVIVQEACTATVPPQFELALKLPPEPAEVAATLAIASGAFPVFVSLTVCWLVAPTSNGE